ncbi:MAG: hypothetical protein AAB692_00470 [Patescibacteria group bacterium]
MKTLITHIRPHLDDLCAMWLLRHFAPEFKDSAVDFIPTNKKGGETKANPDFTYIGVGRGQFDEHKGDIGKCATSLVFDHLKERNLLGDGAAAAEKLTTWALEEDTGKLHTIPYRDFTVPIILQSTFDLSNRDSRAVADLGFKILDALFVAMRNTVEIEADWEKRIAFMSRFGSAVALESDARGVDSHGYIRGFDVVVIVNKARTHHTIRAKAGTNIDLTSVYRALKEKDPEAAWYFHHSKKLLICGGDITSEKDLSKMTVEQLVELLK